MSNERMSAIAALHASSTRAHKRVQGFAAVTHDTLQRLRAAPAAAAPAAPRDPRQHHGGAPPAVKGMQARGAHVRSGPAPVRPDRDDDDTKRADKPQPSWIDLCSTSGSDSDDVIVIDAAEWGDVPAAPAPAVAVPSVVAASASTGRSRVGLAAAAVRVEHSYDGEYAFEAAAVPAAAPPAAKPAVKRPLVVSRPIIPPQHASRKRPRVEIHIIDDSSSEDGDVDDVPPQHAPAAAGEWAQSHAGDSVPSARHVGGGPAASSAAVSSGGVRIAKPVVAGVAPTHAREASKTSHDAMPKSTSRSRTPSGGSTGVAPPADTRRVAPASSLLRPDVALPHIVDPAVVRAERAAEQERTYAAARARYDAEMEQNRRAARAAASRAAAARAAAPPPSAAIPRGTPHVIVTDAELTFEAAVALGGRATPTTPYACLGLPMDASEHAIKKRYRALAKLLHPDRRRGDENVRADNAFKAVASAYALLMATA